MPESLCTCESLVTLTLSSSPNICFPKNISFPRLESLGLTQVEFRDECWYEQLFSNCPVLESLLMVSCTWSDMKSFCISNPALKHLIIVNADFRNCALKIHAPRLEILSYIGRVAKDYILSSFPTLVKAYIKFFFEEDGAMWEQMIDYGAVVSKFLQALAHVANLRISGPTLQVLSIADGLLNNLPSFHNLRKLSLIDEVTADKALIALLETAPNLESVRI
ncbi:F-box/FBD/LRR-repeat protein At1g16930-like [Papaver somniferum]|nr:F-box/FBD/LRR-repeat protein At1g16930-like [Papaver somniferum]